MIDVRNKKSIRKQDKSDISSIVNRKNVTFNNKASVVDNALSRVLRSSYDIMSKVNQTSNSEEIRKNKVQMEHDRRSTDSRVRNEGRVQRHKINLGTEVKR